MEENNNNTYTHPNEDVFEIAAKAQQLLHEILSANKLNTHNALLLQQQQQKQQQSSQVKQEPNLNASSNLAQCLPQTSQVYSNEINHQTYSEQKFHHHHLQQQQQPLTSSYYQPQSQHNLYPMLNSLSQQPPPSAQYIYHQGMTQPTQHSLLINPTFYMQHPPPSIMPAAANTGPTLVQQPYYYQTAQQTNPAIRSNYYHAYNTSSAPNHTPVVQMQQQHHHHYYQPSAPFSNASNLAPNFILTNRNNNPYFRKRKISELINENNGGLNGKNRFATYNGYAPKTNSYFTSYSYEQSGDSFSSASKLVPNSNANSDPLSSGNLIFGTFNQKVF